MYWRRRRNSQKSSTGTRHRIRKQSISRGRNSDQPANRLLDHGNYLAYGLAATTLWVLGIPHGFAVMHGKTRRGALVLM